MLKKAVLACVLTTMACLAQQGHPLTGTWIGDWGSAAAPRSHITLVMNWDGDKVTGVINPGPDSAPLQSVTVDYAKWTVRLEAQGKDAAGNPVRIAAEAKINDLGSPRRQLIGTWRQNDTAGDFKVTRE